MVVVGFLSWLQPLWFLLYWDRGNYPLEWLCSEFWLFSLAKIWVQNIKKLPMVMWIGSPQESSRSTPMWTTGAGTGRVQKVAKSLLRTSLHMPANLQKFSFFSCTAHSRRIARTNVRKSDLWCTAQVVSKRSKKVWEVRICRDRWCWSCTSEPLGTVISSIRGQVVLTL